MRRKCIPLFLRSTKTYSAVLLLLPATVQQLTECSYTLLSPSTTSTSKVKEKHTFGLERPTANSQQPTVNTAGNVQYITYKRNMGRFRYNIHCRRIAIRMTYSECTSVALVIQHTTRMQRTILLYVFFWVIPRRLNVICRRFGTLCLFHLHRPTCL